MSAPWLFVAFALGIGCSDFAIDAWQSGGASAEGQVLIILGGGGLLCGLLGIALGWRHSPRWRRRMGHAGVALLAFVLGGAALSARFAEGLSEVPRAPELVLLEGRVHRVFLQTRGVSVDLVACRRLDAGPRAPRRLRLRDGGLDPSPLAALVPGERLRFRARLIPPQGRRNPGGASKRRILARRGIAAEAWLVTPGVVARMGLANDGLRGRLAARRTQIGRRLRREGAGGALLAALSLGDRRGLGDASDVFRSLGIAHVLALSGLHFATLGALVFVVGRRVALRVEIAERVDPRSVGIAAVVTGLCLFALFVGSAVSVSRAWMVAMVGALLWFLGRKVSSIAILALVASVYLALEPALLFEPGAQLSFGACAGLLTARTHARSRLARALRASAAANLATAPILAGGLGTVSFFSLPANVLLVPWFAGLLLPIALLTSLCIALSLPGSAGLIEVAAVLAERSLEGIAWLAGPGAAPYPVAPHPHWQLVALLAASAALRARRWVWLIAASAALPVFLARVPVRESQPSVPRVVVFDVGQGDAALVQSHDAAILIDGGFAATGRGDRGLSTLVPALTALGVRALDLVIASHRDLDHRGGLVAIVRRIPVDTLWLPYGSRADPAFSALISEAKTRGVSIAERGAGASPWRRNGLRVDPLWPTANFQGSANDRSLVVRVGVRGVQALFCGDLELAGERALLASGVDLHAHLLKVPHHGSRSSSSPAFVNAVSPLVAIASASAFNRFGMPDSEVRARYQRAGANFWWTGQSGALWFHMTDPLWVRATVSARENH